MRKSIPAEARAFELGILVPVVSGLALNVILRPSWFDPILVPWIVAVAAVELMPVPAYRGMQLSLSLPILLGVAILYPAPVAASVAFLGSFDPREVRGEISVLSSLFNRSQTALAVFLGGTVFHFIGTMHSEWYVLILGGLAAALTTYTANVLVVAVEMHLRSRVPIRDVVRSLRVGGPSEFLLNYLGLSLIGVVIARLYLNVGFWSVAAFIAPLVFARQMFFRSKALEEASDELKDRQRVLRALSNRMAEERQDEREMIAAYLHDDLAQTLFQLTLRLEMAKKRLKRSDLEGVGRDLDDISEIKEATSDKVRSLVRDLHRSPIGRAGLADAIRGFADEARRGSDVQFAVDVVEVTLPPPIQLLIYQIAREAIMNSVKHAAPSNIWVSMHEAADGVELQVRDDGAGFDSMAPQPEGHFGRVMMRERAMVAGGSLATDSALGRGTVVTARFPRVWLEEGTRAEPKDPAALPAEGPHETPPPKRLPLIPRRKRAERGVRPSDGPSSIPA